MQKQLDAKEVANRIRWRVRANADTPICDLLENRTAEFCQEVAEALWEMVQRAQSTWLYLVLGEAYAMVKDMAV